MASPTECCSLAEPQGCPIPIGLVHVKETPNADLCTSLLEHSNPNDDTSIEETLPKDTSLNSIVNAAHSIKETVQQTLKCRENQIPVADEGIEKKLADLEKVIMCNASDGSKMCDVKAEPLDPPSMELGAEVVVESFEGKEPSVLPVPGMELGCSVLEENIGPDDISSSEPNEPTEVNGLLEEQDTGRLPKSIASNKRKSEKTADQVLKLLNVYETTEDKLRALCKKHAEVLEDQRTSELKQRQSERYAAQLAREKETLQAEHNRNVLARSRLEGLCRELQRQNKAIKDESLLRIREEEEKRKDIASKFQSTLNDITALMQDNQQKNSQLREENTELAQKLKSLVDHYETWEKHMEKVVRQKELESQLAKAKLNKAHLHMREEQEKFLTEKKQLLENINTLQIKSTELVKNELQVRTELSLYTSKYEEFQTVLAKSNEVFSSFKVDMDKMSKKIKVLEKETCQWKTKWENSNRSLIAMAADKQKRDKDLMGTKQQVSTLEKLCRALQTERVELQTLLKQCHCTHVNKKMPTIENTMNEVE